MHDGYDMFETYVAQGNGIENKGILMKSEHRKSEYERE
jgi:hypothetical protein